jgi:hypothetical protein
MKKWSDRLVVGAFVPDSDHRLTRIDTKRSLLDPCSHLLVELARPAAGASAAGQRGSRHIGPFASAGTLIGR